MPEVTLLAAGDDGRPAHQQPESPVWMYPSEQMFYNAMRRKGWSPSEQDMQSVVAIHNGVNERAWSEVRLAVAAVTACSCPIASCAHDETHGTSSDVNCVLQSPRRARCAGAAMGEAAQDSMWRSSLEEICRAAPGLQPKGSPSELPWVQIAL